MDVCRGKQAPPRKRCQLIEFKPCYRRKPGRRRSQGSKGSTSSFPWRISHLLRSNAMGEVKPKGRCQCHASSDGEGQSPNYLFHGVTLFWLCWNCQSRAKKSVIAITF